MRLPNMTIPSGQQNSNAVELVGVNEVTVYGPAALTGTVAVQVSPDGGTTWLLPAVAVAVDAVVEIPQINASHIRVTSDMAEAADRVFPLHGAGPEIA